MSFGPKTLQAPLLAETAKPTSCVGATSRKDLLGIAFIMASELLNAFVNALVKQVSGWPQSRLMLVRFCIDLVISLGVIRCKRIRAPNVVDLLWLLARGASYCAGLVCFWMALQSCLPLGDVVVTVVALAPLFLAVFAWLVLREAIPSSWPIQMVF